MPSQFATGARRTPDPSNNRQTDLEKKLNRHIEREMGHTIWEGCHRWIYDDANLTETYVIYADSERTRKRFEQVTKHDAAAPTHILYRRIRFFTPQGVQYKALVVRNFTYTTDGTDRDAGFDIVEDRG